MACPALFRRLAGLTKRAGLIPQLPVSRLYLRPQLLHPGRQLRLLLLGGGQLLFGRAPLRSKLHQLFPCPRLLHLEIFDPLLRKVPSSLGAIGFASQPGDQGSRLLQPLLERLQLRPDLHLLGGKLVRPRPRRLHLSLELDLPPPGLLQVLQHRAALMHHEAELEVEQLLREALPLARCLRLLRQRLHLRIQLVDDVVHPCEVRVDLVELPGRFVLALPVALDARRLLEDLPPVFRPH